MVDDDLGGCFVLLLRKSPYSTKMTENVTGRQISAKLVVTTMAVLVIKLKQWHYFTYIGSCAFAVPKTTETKTTQQLSKGLLPIPR
jgi:hypothetical protein